MPPIPCAHCGNNFMRTTIDPEAPKLCNNCSLREEKRNPKKEKKMEMVKIVIECPQDIHAEIEEMAINKGTTYSKYFLDLHKLNTQERFIIPKTSIKDESFKEAIEEVNDQPQRTKKYKK